MFAFASTCSAANPSGASDNANKAQKLLYLGSGTVGSTAYLSSSGIATVISNNSDYIQVNCQVTSGSSENYSAMLAGDMDMILVSAGLSYRIGHPEIPKDASLNEIYPFDANPDVRYFVNGFPFITSYIVRADSEIKTIQDILKPGVRIGFPTPGAEAYSYNKAFIEVLGFNLNDLNVYYAERAELVDSFKDGNIDVIVGVMGDILAPNSTINELSLATDIRIISLDDETLALFKRVFPVVTKGILPAGWTRGVDSEVATVVLGADFLITKDVPDDVVYDMCKALFENLDELDQIGAVFKYLINKETATANVSCPIHPGALKYYEENGFAISYAPDYDY
jgi:TRAP transporter TAXI family solute receptor